ncbi:MAG: tetratricopeptide repeat protein [Candidatus Babeliales bacterium]
MKRVYILLLAGEFAAYANPEALTPADIKKEADEVNHYHWSLWGNYQYRQGNIKQAANWYSKILGDNPTPYALHGYVTALYKSHNYPAILNVLPALDEQFANDRDMQLIFAQALLYTKNFKDAHAKFSSIYEKNKTHAESAYFAAESYSRLQEYTKAMDVIDTYLKHSTQQHTDFLFYFLKAQIFAVQHYLEKAREFALKTLEMNPRFEQAAVFLQLLDNIEREILKSGAKNMTQSALRKFIPQVQKQSNNFYQTEKTIYFSRL